MRYDCKLVELKEKYGRISPQQDNASNVPLTV